MTFEGLFSIIKERFLKADVRKFPGFAAFEFQVRGEAAGVFYVEIKHGGISVMPYNYYDRSAIITADGSTLLEICRGELAPLIAYAVGRVKVQGDLQKIQSLVTLL